MASQWVYTQEGKQYGPVSSSQLKALADSGKLKPFDLVWKEGMSQWVAGSKIQNLFAGEAPNTVSAGNVAPPIPALLSPSIQKAGESPGSPAPSTNAWKSVISRRMSQVVLIEHSEGLGSGLLVRKDGLIITNKHVVEGSTFVNICFSNNTTTKGVVVHNHPGVDLAVVKAAVHDTDCLDINGESAAQVEAGDEVIAIGHPHGLRFTSTRGIVSSPKRRYGQEFFVQHDVAINTGNSGGPLIDDRGNLLVSILLFAKILRGWVLPSPPRSSGFIWNRSSKLW